MSEFLDRLAGRALKLVPTLQPRVPTRYEPQQVMAGSSDLAFTADEPLATLVPSDSLTKERQRRSASSADTARDGSNTNGQSALDAGSLPPPPLQPIPKNDLTIELPEKDQWIHAESAYRQSSDRPRPIALDEKSIEPVPERSYSPLKINPPSPKRVDTASSQLHDLHSTPTIASNLAAPEEPSTKVGEPHRESNRQLQLDSQVEPRRMDGKRSAVEALKLQRVQDPRVEASRNQPDVHITIGKIEIRAASIPQPSPRPVKNGPVVMSLEEYLRKRSGGEA